MQIKTAQENMRVKLCVEQTPDKQQIMLNSRGQRWQVKVVQQIIICQGGSLSGSCVRYEPDQEFMLHSIDPHCVGFSRPRPDHRAVF